MDFNEKKRIILSYIDADIAGIIPSAPAYVPGVGQSPNLNAHAEDTFRLIIKHWRGNLGDAMIEQLGRMMKVI